MRKQKISSKLVDTRTLVIYELDQFIAYIWGTTSNATATTPKINRTGIHRNNTEQ
ncbi:MAG: hypothetical protein V7K40_23725 [Nostoc sp.]